MVLDYIATIRFTRDLDSIRDGIFPERQLGFACISRIDFSDMTKEEKETVRSSYEKQTDFWERKWQKVMITLFDGSVWSNVFIYDKCVYKSAYESSSIYSLDVTKIVIRAKGNCD
jgi:hypothetical protein